MVKQTQNNSGEGRNFVLVTVHNCPQKPPKKKKVFI